MVAALAWAMSGVLAYIFPGSNMGEVGSLSWHLIESSDAIAELGMLAAIAGLHVRQRARYGRLGAISSLVAFLGTAALFVSTVIWIATETDGVLLDMLFSSGALAILVGFPLLGVATVRADALPRWCGLLLVSWIVYFPLIFYAIDFYGEFRAVFCLVWMALAYALHDKKGIWAGRPALA